MHRLTNKWVFLHQGKSLHDMARAVPSVWFIKSSSHSIQKRHERRSHVNLVPQLRCWVESVIENASLSQVEAVEIFKLSKWFYLEAKDKKNYVSKLQYKHIIQSSFFFWQNMTLSNWKTNYCFKANLSQYRPRFKLIQRFKYTLIDFTTNSALSITV